MARAKAAERERITVSKRWWGIDIVMNDKLTQDVIAGVEGGGALAAGITSAFATASVITGGAAAVIGVALAAIFAAKVFEIKVIDNGKGVHWPISWPQWAALIGSAPAGPTAIVAVAMVVLHPLRNEQAAEETVSCEHWIALL